MKLLKFTYLILLFILVANMSYSQLPTVSVSGVHVIMEDMALKSQGVNDPNNDSLLVSVTFSVNNPKDIKALTFNYGTLNGLGNIFSKEAHYVNQNGQEFIEFNGEWYPIVAGQVTVKNMLSKSVIQPYSVFLTISGSQKTGTAISALHNQVK